MAAAAIPVGLALAGTTFQVIGNIKEANARAQQAEFQAQQSEAQANEFDFNAGVALSQAQEEERRSRYQTAKTLGSIRAAYGASGVTMDGSPQYVQEEAATIGEANAISIRHQGFLQARAYKKQAQALRSTAEQMRQGGSDAIAAGNWGAANAILSGGYNVAKDYVSYGRSSDLLSRTR